MSTQTNTAQKPRKERKENADKRRQQLLDATLRSIAANGLAKTTLATVAAEAGLSQGVAVFYFKSKTGLLTEALRAHYERYQAHWMEALENAGDDPVQQLITLIEAEFSPVVSDAQALSIWFAFWGEQTFTPQYAEVSAAFDSHRTAESQRVCAALMPGASPEETRLVADWIETLTEGYWQHLHVFPATTNRQEAAASTLELAARLMPEHAARILAKRG
ncbi:TetR family transcriptional regulator [Roseovarius aestuarii]|nr:TetR family transcriptional regulator [Roseovarius aestuarii]